MPFFRIDVIEGRSAEDLCKLLDTLHECATEAFSLPTNDRFQIVSEHKPHQMQIRDIGLGFKRTEDIVVVQMTTTPRTLNSRKRFYAMAAERLEKVCDLSPQDLMINIVETSESNWSFGAGRPQFLDGAL